MFVDGLAMTPHQLHLPYASPHYILNGFNDLCIPLLVFALLYVFTTWVDMTNLLVIATSIVHFCAMTCPCSREHHYSSQECRLLFWGSSSTSCFVSTRFRTPNFCSCRKSESKIQNHELLGHKRVPWLRSLRLNQQRRLLAGRSSTTRIWYVFKPPSL